MRRTLQRLALSSLLAALLFGVGGKLPLERSPDSLARKERGSRACSQLVGFALRPFRPTLAAAQETDGFEALFAKIAAVLGMPVDFFLRVGTWTVTTENTVEPPSPLALLNVYPLLFDSDGNIRDIGIADAYLWKLAENFGADKIVWSTDKPSGYSSDIGAIYLNPDENPVINQRVLARALVHSAIDRSCGSLAGSVVVGPILESIEKRVRIVQWANDLDASASKAAEIQDILEPAPEFLPPPYGTIRGVLDVYHAQLMAGGVESRTQLEKVVLDPRLPSAGYEYLKEDTGFQEGMSAAGFALWQAMTDQLAECIERSSCKATEGPLAFVPASIAQSGAHADFGVKVIAAADVDFDAPTVPSDVLREAEQHIKDAQRAARELEQAFNRGRVRLFDPNALNTGRLTTLTPEAQARIALGDQYIRVLGKIHPYINAIREGYTEAKTDIVRVVRDHPWFKFKFNVNRGHIELVYEISVPAGTTEPQVLVSYLKGYGPPPVPTTPAPALKVAPSLAVRAWSYVRPLFHFINRPLPNVVASGGTVALRGLGIVGNVMLANDLWNAIYLHLGNVSLFPHLKTLIVEKWNLDGELTVPAFRGVEEIILRDISLNRIITFQGAPVLRKLTLENVNFRGLPPGFSFIPVVDKDDTTYQPGSQVSGPIEITFKDNGWEALPSLDGFEITRDDTVRLSVREQNLRSATRLIPLLNYFKSRGRDVLLNFDPTVRACTNFLPDIDATLKVEQQDVARILHAVNVSRVKNGLPPLELRCSGVTRFL